MGAMEDLQKIQSFFVTNYLFSCSMGPMGADVTIVLG
jgi:hypothetical protein